MNVSKVTKFVIQNVIFVFSVISALFHSSRFPPLDPSCSPLPQPVPSPIPTPVLQALPRSLSPALVITSMKIISLLYDIQEPLLQNHNYVFKISLSHTPRIYSLFSMSWRCDHGSNSAGPADTLCCPQTKIYSLMISIL